MEFSVVKETWKKGNDEKELAIENLEEEIENLKAVKTQNAENLKEKAEESVQELEDIVFETLITFKKNKWAMKDKTFAECIIEKYKVNMELLCRLVWWGRRWSWTVN